MFTSYPLTPWLVKWEWLNLLTCDQVSSLKEERREEAVINILHYIRLFCFSKFSSNVCCSSLCLSYVNSRVGNRDNLLTLYVCLAALLVSWPIKSFRSFTQKCLCSDRPRLNVTDWLTSATTRTSSQLVNISTEAGRGRLSLTVRVFVLLYLCWGVEGGREAEQAARIHNLIFYITQSFEMLQICDCCCSLKHLLPTLRIKLLESIFNFSRGKHQTLL